MGEHGPERLAGQGLDPNQYESGDRAIISLLSDPPACDQVDLVATWRAGAYEVWARRGMIRFTRHDDSGGGLRFEVTERIGVNPIENQDPFAVSSIAEEVEAARRTGHPCDDPNRAFIDPQALSYPHAYERIAQLFDSPRAPDLIVSPRCYAYGIQAGQHGALDVVQSRAPLLWCGPGVKPGRYQIAARHVDIAPTIAHLMGFPLIAGCGPSGESARVYLKRQDGRALKEIAALGSARPRRVYLILMDGLSNSELLDRLEHDPASIPNLAALARDAAFLTHGSIANFPTITWPSHSTILSGAWCGHHDIVNPTFHVREERATVPVQGNVFETERWLNPEVETLYEAFKRVYGATAITASIHEPQGRGADHAVFERRIVGDKTRLKALTAEMNADISPRWNADKMPAMAREEVIDIRGMAQVLNLFDHCADAPPVFVAHEFVLTDGAGHDYGPHHPGLREALARTDRRIGAVLRLLRERGLLESTLIVVTSDHGMAAQMVELKANPTVGPAAHGIKAVFAEPMIYLRDVAIECARARDARSLRVAVADNDRERDGNRPALKGAEATLRDGEGRVLGSDATGADGVAVFATPANLSDRELTVTIEHRDFNSRTVRADGSPTHRDPRAVLYPDFAAAGLRG